MPRYTPRQASTRQLMAAYMQHQRARQERAQARRAAFVALATRRHHSSSSESSTSDTDSDLVSTSASPGSNASLPSDADLLDTEMEIDSDRSSITSFSSDDVDEPMPALLPPGVQVLDPDEMEDMVFSDLDSDLTDSGSEADDEGSEDEADVLGVNMEIHSHLGRHVRAAINDAYRDGRKNCARPSAHRRLRVIDTFHDSIF